MILSLTTFEDSREAIEKLLPTSLIYQPNEETIMMDYIPRIQMMISTNADQKSGRSTRSKRKRLYLPLNEDCVDTLIKDKSFIDEVIKATHVLVFFFTYSSYFID